MSADLSNLDILIVDDNTQMCLLMRTFLRGFGVMNVRLAHNADAAFEVLGRKPTDLIILDWLMEPVSGMEFLRRLRHVRREPHCRTPVVMISAHGDTDKVIEARAMGVTQFLTKPISADVLKRRLQWALENPVTLVRRGEYYLPTAAKAEAAPAAQPQTAEEDAWMI